MNRLFNNIYTIPNILPILLSSSVMTCFCSTNSTQAKMPEVNLNIIKDRCKELVPELHYQNHKGQCGRIGVFGGSIEFTGAPYYSAFSALRSGVDLVYVFCATSAAQAIKSYCPELIVLPYLDSDTAVDNIAEWLKRLHAILIGPGLGRDEKVFAVLIQVIDILNKGTHPPIVLDADGLYFLSKYPDVFRNYKNNVYITPNIIEFSRLTNSILGKKDKQSYTVLSIELSQKLATNVTVILKGEEDIITQGDLSIKCPTKGSPRRCGGQGDLLSGILTAFAAWIDIKKPKFDCNYITPELVAGYSACHIVKRCNRLVYYEKGRGALVTDMLEKVLYVSLDMFGETIDCNLVKK